MIICGHAVGRRRTVLSDAPKMTMNDEVAMTKPIWWLSSRSSPLGHVRMTVGSRVRDGNSKPDALPAVWAAAVNDAATRSAVPLQGRVSE